ncbi:hypothetical protein [Labedaea rhizosphaerae]|uniref:Uncharacterized protein n=1 Tax=Labedaea rhizosphaerae TaxID=598644 RepID=A0A4R6SMH5_LABRH|nr:hypothetical protein [Labedaea rhizosphaerae]TDQ04760.1 hypothetical protein EV186_101717 [Labedaea rhizosphaerae]
MAQQDSFPVLKEQPLSPAIRGWLRRSRDVSELPQHIPGTVPVFEVDSGYVAFTERRHLHKRDDLVINAISVTTVDMRPRTVTVSLQIPSSSPADDFFVMVDFRCQVRDAELVAQYGLRDLVEPLRQYLRRDATLFKLGVQHTVEQINDVREKVWARVEAYVRVRGPMIDGVVVEFAGVRTATPKELAEHERRMRDTRRDQLHKGLVHQGEDRDADRYSSYLERGATAIAGITVARGERTVAAAADRVYELEERKQEQMMELLKSLSDAEKDMIAVDAQRVVDSLMDRLVGGRPTASHQLEGDGDRGQLEA